MTVRVTVKTHGCPANVSVDGADLVKVDSHQARTFDVTGESSLTIREEEPSAEHGMGDHLPLDPTDVPGREENDALLSRSTTGAEGTGSQQRSKKGEPPADASA